MKLIVFGPTGGTGLELLAQGQAAGYEMTAFSRRAFDTSARIVLGDATDRDAVADAVRGQDVVLSALGTRPWRHAPAGCVRCVAAQAARRGVVRVLHAGARDVR